MLVSSAQQTAIW